jgi:holliday junction DNA helicase RuvB
LIKKRLPPLLVLEPIDFEEMAASAIVEAIQSIEIKPFQPSVNDPTSFEEFIGQESSKEVLTFIIEASIKRNEPLPNILLTGKYGHGKTTLARLIAERVNKSIRIIDGALAETALANPNSDTIYIVDEIHNITPVLADSLNILLDSKELHMIGCTTSPGKLSSPFRSRFRLIYLEDYTEGDIKKIVFNAASRSDVHISQETLDIVASRSQYNPRMALAVLDFLKEIATVEDLTEISKSRTLEALNSLKIDDRGLTEIDRRYLDVLRYDTPVGLRHIMSVLSLDSATIEEQIEPYLLKMGFIDRTARGRIKAMPWISK